MMSKTRLESGHFFCNFLLQNYISKLGKWPLSSENEPRGIILLFIWPDWFYVAGRIRLSRWAVRLRGWDACDPFLFIVYGRTLTFLSFPFLSFPFSQYPSNSYTELCHFKIGCIVSSMKLALSARNGWCWTMLTCSLTALTPPLPLP